MNKKSLLFLLLMALFAPLAMNGQGTLTVCNGTVENRFIPFYAYSGDTQGTTSEFIIPESNLTALNGKSITALKFYLSQSQSKTWTAVYKVYMAEVATTQLTRTIGPDAGTVVYQGTVDASGSEMTITFNQGNYTYNGGHLLIGTYVATAGAWDSNGMFYGIAATSAAYLSGDWNGNETGAKDFIPKTTFTYLSDDPYITLAPADATVLTGFNETLTATYGNVSGTPTITYTSSNNNVATVSGSGTTATVTAVAPGTATITATMTYNGNTYTAQCAITVEDPSYCTPGTGGYDNNGISNVTFGTNGVVVNNTVGGINYGDYSNLVGAVEAGTTCQVDITYKTGYTYGTIIWVDWNHNYTFEGTEAVYAGQSTSSNPTTLNATFDVPATTQIGDYRMRIIGADQALDNYTGSLSAAANVNPCGSFSWSTCHDYTLRVTSASNCKKPTDLAATNVTKNSATLSWTENGEATAWNISVNGNVTPNVTNPYNLTGLTPETSYTVKVCPVCEDERWSDEITFTTLVACPAPTNVTANQVTNNSAEISFDGADSYNIRYCTMTETSYDFEDGLWSGWSTIDNDGDDYAWVVTDQQGSTTGGSATVESHGGDYYVVSSYNEEALAENWLISPQINLGGSINFYIKRLNNSNYDDYYRVYLSTTGTSISDFTVEIQGEREPATSYEFVTIDLSNYSGSGYVAIKHYAKYNDQAYIFIDDVTILEPSSWQYTNDLTLTGLDAETNYEVQVQANCGSEDGTSAWVSTTFTTLDNCALPYELSTTNLTAASATLNWTGAQEAYNVQYREVITEPVNLTYDFEDNTLQGWTPIDNDGDGDAWMVSSTPHTGSYCARSYYTPSGSSYNANNWLVSPQITLGGAISFYAKQYDSDERFQVFVSTTGTNISDFSAISEVINPSETYQQYTYSLSDYSGQGYIAIVHTSTAPYAWYIYVDDITITRSGEYGPWVTKTNVTSPLNLDDLTPTIENGNHYLPINYEWQVQGINCNGNGTATDWSAPVTFTTPEGYIKPINGYTGQNGGYNLIASPIGTIDNSDLEEKVINIFSNSYDLYYFNQSGKQGENYLEWINYKPDDGPTSTATDPLFDLVRGKGYLYANSQTVDLVFTGVAPSTEDFEVPLAYDGDARFKGWNLVGNPYAVPAYFTTDRDFYTMNSAGTSFEVCEDPDRSIEAMQGVFVIAKSNNETLTFTTTQPTSKGRGIVLNLGEGRENIDRAIVRFGEGRTLPKLQLFEGSTKIYIPQDGKEYAVVRSEEMGEMPVNFKAENNGTFSLNVSGQNTEFAYLHLIDNLTGNDVDLLETPSYSFEAKTTDYASRFKLVYATGNASDDTFAFYNNGSFVINNEGNAELQVVDVMGRILSSETINGCANVSVNGAAGVYMLRLVNGDNVKVQKVVVK